MTAEHIFAALESGDPIAARVVDDAVELWGMAAANLVSLFNPETIVFGGGVFGPAGRFLDRIRAEAARWAQPIAMQQVRFVVSTLGGDAGLLGAARLAPGGHVSNRRMLFAIACLGMLAFGIVLTTLGAVLPSVIERFGIDKAVAGSLFLLMTFGILVGSVVFGPIVDRNGYKGMLLFALTLIVVGLEGIAFAPSIGWLRVAIATIGFGGGIINGGTNALVADVSAEGRTAGLSLLGVFFGVGAVGVPFVLEQPAGCVLVHRDHCLGRRARCRAASSITAATPFPAPKHAARLPARGGKRAGARSAAAS